MPRKTTPGCIRTILVAFNEADYSVCWGEHNYFKANSVPVVFTHLETKEDNTQRLVYGSIFEQSFEPRNFGVDDDGNSEWNKASFTIDAQVILFLSGE